MNDREKLARIRELVYSDLRFVYTDVLQNILEDAEPYQMKGMDE